MEPPVAVVGVDETTVEEIWVMTVETTTETIVDDPEVIVTKKY